MNTFLTIVLAVLVFGIIIFIHELGHFSVAKLFKVKVHEFAMGMGPTLFSFKKGETKYAVRLFPIGGFVSMEGEDQSSEDASAFCNKAVYKRILIVLAGALMNLLLGLLIVMILVLQSSGSLIGTNKIAMFEENAVSSQSLKIGDEVLSINNRRLLVTSDLAYELSRAKTGKLDFTVRRDGKVMELKDVPFAVEKIDDQNILIRDFKFLGVKKDFLNVTKETFLWTLSIARMIWISLVDLITGNIPINQLSGPIGVTSAIGQAASAGLYPLLMLVAFLTINIGIFNLLPFPALDGSRAVFLIIEAIRRKPIKPEREGFVHFVGIILLFALMAVVSFSDIWKEIAKFGR